MTDQTTQLAVNIDLGPGADSEELADMTARLRTQLLDLDVDDVTLASDGAAPEGAKAAEAVVLGTLLVKLLATKGVLTGMIQMLRDWALRDEKRSITMQIGKDKLTITGMSSEDQERLITSWIEKHQAGSTH